MHAGNVGGRDTLFNVQRFADFWKAKRYVRCSTGDATWCEVNFRNGVCAGLTDAGRNDKFLHIMVANHNALR